MSHVFSNNGEGMATQSSILASGNNPLVDRVEPGGLQSNGDKNRTRLSDWSSSIF